jgi:hypothetical protein
VLAFPWFYDTMAVIATRTGGIDVERLQEEQYRVWESGEWEVGNEWGVGARELFRQPFIHFPLLSHLPFTTFPAAERT